MNNIINVEHIVFYMGIIMALAFIIMGIVLLNKNKIKKCTCKTIGKIIDNVQHKEKDVNDNWRYYWHCLCEYNVNGIKCMRESTIGTNLPKYEVGQEVEIHYNPKNCHESYIVGDENSKTLGLILISLGVIILVVLLIFI